MREGSRADAAERLAALEAGLRQAHLELLDARGQPPSPDAPPPQPASPPPADRTAQPARPGAAPAPAAGEPCRPTQPPRPRGAPAPPAGRTATRRVVWRRGRTVTRRAHLTAFAAGAVLLVLGGGAAVLGARVGGDAASPGAGAPTSAPRAHAGGLPAPVAGVHVAATRLIAPLGGCVALADARALARRPGRLDAMRRRAAGRGARRALARLRHADPPAARAARARARVARTGAAAGVARFDARHLLLPVAVRDRSGTCVAPSRAAISAGTYPLVTPGRAAVRTVAIARAS